MAIGFLKTLAQRLAQPFVELSVRLRHTAARTMQAIGRAGVDIEAGVLREQIQRTHAVREATERIIGQPADTIIDPRNMAEAVTKQRRQFAWAIKTQFVSAVTGKVETRFTTISTDSLLSANEAIAEAEALLESDYNIRAGAIVESEVSRVTRAGPAGIL